MTRRWTTDRRAPSCSVVARIHRVLLVIALSLGTLPAARANCFNIRDPQFRRLRALISRNADVALTQVQAGLAALPASEARTDPRRVATLYALQSIADDYLDLYARQRVPAQKGLALVPDPTDPLHLVLLRQYARSFLDPAGLSHGLVLIKSARARLPPGSRADLCLEIAQSALELLQQHPGTAILHASEAYARSVSPSLAEPHAQSTALLSAMLRGTGDFAAASRLIRSKLAWDRARGEDFSYRRDLFLEAEILEDMHRYRRAIAAFRHTRALAAALKYRLGTAFPDVQICRSQIPLGQLAEARRHCGRALPVFLATGPVQMVKETRLLMARIDLAEGRPARARSVIDSVLDHGGSDMLDRDVGPAFLVRSQANAALHRYGEAYSDLLQYQRRYAALREQKLRGLKEELAIRFQLRERTRNNAQLKRELQTTIERARQQRDLLRTIELAGAAGALGTVLLLYILLAAGRHRRRLLHLATRDALTGLPNRGHTAQLAKAALAAAHPPDKPVTVALIDLDHFKVLNDRCGHAAGDHVLREFARLARGVLRNSDIFGRWGGEEFLLVMPDTTLESALASVERLRLLALRSAVPPNGRLQEVPRVTISAGLATTAGGTRSLDEIVARADAALYKAKNDGRNLVRVDQEAGWCAAHDGAPH